MRLPAYASRFVRRHSCFSLAQCASLQIYTQRRPFADLNEAQVIAQLMRNQRPKRALMKSGRPIPDEIWSLIERCWTSAIGDRPDMKSIVLELTKRHSSEATESAEPNPDSVDDTAVFPNQSEGSKGPDLDIINLIYGSCGSLLIKEVVLSVRGSLADRFLCTILKVSQKPVCGRHADTMIRLSRSK